MTIIQKPNKLLITAFIGFAISKYPENLVSRFGSVLFTVTIIIWAYQEATGGINMFRKLLGFFVLLLIAWELFKNLH